MILVTGGTGFLGAELLRQLIAKGETKIRAIRRASSSMDYIKDIVDKIEWVEADVLDFPALEDAFESVTEVYHCAAVITFASQKKDLMHKVNIEGTKNIVDLCLDKKVNKLVHVSSIAAIGRSSESNLVDEKTEWDEASPLNTEYAKSKQRSEMEVWRGNAEGLNMVIVNPSVILGPINWDEGTGKFFKNIWNGFSFYTSGNTGFVDVKDVAHSMVELMKSDISGERFIISGWNKSYKYLLESIADALGKPRPKRQVSPFLSALVWRLEAFKAMFSKKEPLLTKETANLSRLSYEYQNQKLVEALDFTFIPFEESISRTAKVFLEQH